MNKYELALVVNAKIEDDERAAAAETAKQMIPRYVGVVPEVEGAAKQRLAHESRRRDEGSQTS